MQLSQPEIGERSAWLAVDVAAQFERAASAAGDDERNDFTLRWCAHIFMLIMLVGTLSWLEMIGCLLFLRRVTCLVKKSGRIGGLNLRFMVTWWETAFSPASMPG